MQYHYRLFLWENGHRFTEYTQHLSFPIFIEDRLNEELDTAEIVLEKMPIALNNPFPPKTKFRLERYITKEYTDIPKTWDFIVEHDDVELYVGAPELCCHRLYLIEPSAVAQGMHIDNIAMTYELQDVTTNYKTYSSDSDKAVVMTIGGGDNNNKLRTTEYKDSGGTTTTSYTYSRVGIFKNTYAYLWQGTQELEQIKANIEVSQEHTISFDIPRLFCYGTTTGESWDKLLFEVNTITRVYRYKTQKNSNGGYDIINDSKTIIAEQENGPTTITKTNDEYYYSDGNTAALRLIDSTVVSQVVDTGIGKQTIVIIPNYTTEFEQIYKTAPVIAQIGNYEKSYMELTIEGLSEAEIEEGKGYYYAIEVVANPVNSDGLVTRHETSFTATTVFDGVNYLYTANGKFYDVLTELTDGNQIKVSTSFYARDMSNQTESGYLIMKGVKYSCYDLLRKALLTIDTQIIDNEQMGIDDIDYLITIDPLWEGRLKTAKIQETILENKNLWEVLLQIGYYLHAIPYLEFAEDGTDRFVLKFRQLGDVSNNNNDESAKITIYNSQNLNNYFAQYDSYVSNLFSPQNLVEEWLVVKTTDSSGLISNNTAVLQTTYGISEVVEFDITYDGSSGGNKGTKSALSHIFEQSIYSILTADYNISPSMGDSIYYTLGSTEITGLTYVPPSTDSNMAMSLKRIVGKLFSGVSISKLKFNNLMFHIKYRTQDSMRVLQVRPDIMNFMKSSSYEKYAHHEQFYGQQDKIVDSERLSLNLFGKLVREGNIIVQQQEYVQQNGKEKESGDLVEISDEPYYATVVENEMYPAAIFQKVTYSKNFNQLSQVVTIPSEPRFYEVSERSKIRRDCRQLFDFFAISTIKGNAVKTPRYLNSNIWKNFLVSLIFNKQLDANSNKKIELPNFAWTRFRADKHRVHTGAYGQYVANEQMFPSSEIDRTDPNNITPKASSDHADVIVPLLHFPLKDGIAFEWDMKDNFKAGNATDTTISNSASTVDDAYYAQQSVRYCDIMGRADLYTFRLFNKIDWQISQARDSNKAFMEPEEDECQIFLPSPYFIALDKDCREAISFNYQISLLYRNEDNQGDFVTFSNMFGTKDSELYCCLLSSEVSMFNENTNVISTQWLADKINYSFDEEDGNLVVKISTPIDVDLSEVKSVVFYEIDSTGSKVSYLAKNFKNGITGDSIPNLYIYPVFND